MDFEYLTKVCEKCGERHMSVPSFEFQTRCVKCRHGERNRQSKMCVSCGSYMIHVDDDTCECCEHLLRRGNCTESNRGIYAVGVPEGNDTSFCIFCGNFIYATVVGGVCMGCNIDPLTTNIKPAI